MMTAKVKLKVISGPIKGVEFEISRHDTILFGRASDCHARLPKDGYVSRHHFLLEVNPPHATVRDLGSMNGTRVNGTRFGGRKPRKDGSPLPANESKLKHGDIVTVGKTNIRFRVSMPKAAVPSADLYTPTLSESDAALPSHPKTEFEQPGMNQAAVPGSGGSNQGGIRGLIRKATDEKVDREKPEIEGFHLDEIVGQGGMGLVWHATRTVDNRPVAIKIMSPKAASSEKSRKRFLREIEAVRSLEHPHIVTLLAAGSVGEAFYFVMDYCNGGSLADHAAEAGGSLPFEMLGPLMVQSLEGLAHAHQQGFVHRDLKPANLLLHQTDSGRLAKLSDFGLAKQLQESGMSGMTLTGSFGGTYHYMPREQLTDFKSFRPSGDVWSLAATFYRLLTGQPPRPCPKDRDPMEVVLCDGTIPIRQLQPNFPESLADVFDIALATDTSDRFQSGTEMLAACRDVM